ncbi:MAG: phosphoglycerate kinase [Tidjanibacter sp.]|nr:phosphoglycerate kinase [Tidjanibacter sp.]
MQTIDTYNFSGKRAIIRVDFNVPLDKEFNVTDDTRIRAAIPTIKKVLAGGGSVILMSHLGRPKKNNDEKYSLSHIIGAVEARLGVKVLFAGDCMGEKAAEMAAAIKPGEVLLLENLRFYAEEEGKPRGLAEDATEEEKKEAKKAVKESQKEFVKKLASYADCYINDAFGTAHRTHASTALIADYFPEDKMFGYVMEGELKAIEAVMENPQRPFVAIVGGSKVSTKISIIETLMEKCDKIIIGGGMTYTFAGALGGKVGKSICEPDMFETALGILKKAEEKGIKFVMSPDALTCDDFSNDANTQEAPVKNIDDAWEGVDIGSEGKKLFREEILECKTILWNGPVGVFEIDKFSTGSRAVAEAIAEATQTKGAYSLIGGGDSVACINKFGLADKVSYVSTGGGALLEFIEGKELPGVAAIRK